MRRFHTGLLTLVLLAPFAWADDKPKVDPPANTVKTVKEQIDDLNTAFRKEMGGLQKEFEEAKTAEEKAKIRDKALKTVAPEFGKKLMALAVANPKDPATVDALLMVCSIPGSGSAIPDAVKMLLHDHADSEQLAKICPALTRRDDGEKLIRMIRDKATSKSVKLQAGFYLAQALQEVDDPTPAQTKEAETLLDAFLASAKDFKDISPRLIEQAEGALKDIRVFAVGKVAPAAESKDLDDKPVKLADHKGKVVVLDFWATWCGPCRGMIPHERELVKKHAGKPFVFISVSADESKEDLTKFLKDEEMPWVHWFGGTDGGPVKAWNIHAFPTMYVIDAKGVIRGKIIGGGPQSEKKLDELIEKLVKEAS
jgi:thiol-disulfide isomerase/thioredoxin